MIKALAIGLIFLFGSIAGSAQAKVFIDVTSPDRKVFVAMAPFAAAKGDQKMAATIQDIVRQDLDLTGLFSYIDRAAYLNQDPSPTKVKYTDWTSIGAEVLVKAELERTAKGISINLYVYDVFASQLVLRQQYQGSDTKLRNLAHRASDGIYRLLTGKQSFFLTKILFTWDVSGTRQIYMMDVDGYGRQALTKNRSINFSPAWVSDGRRITFSSYISGDPDLYMLDLRTNERITLSNHHGIEYTSDWFGNELCFSRALDGNTELYLMNSQTRQASRLTNSPGIDIEPSWSPDGSRVAFVSSRSGKPHVYAMDRSGQNMQRLTFAGFHNVNPAWSPRGNLIAFAGKDQGLFDLFMIDPAGTQIQRLTIDAGNNEKPSWSPDGRKILFTSSRSGRYQLYMMNSDGSDIRQITSGPGNFESPAWGPYATSGL